MKALILDGSKKEDNAFNTIIDNITNFLKERNIQVETINLGGLDISSCQGCFDCWIKTPGICIIDDIGRIITMKMVQNDLLILLTPITFGGYSSELKKALDRMIPNILPFYTKIGGEIHHSPRYDKYPIIIGIGLLTSPDQESEAIFSTLVERNSINFYSEKYSSVVIYSNDSLESIHEKMAKVLVEASE
jgi:hypothetical protein